MSKILEWVTVEIDGRPKQVAIIRDMTAEELAERDAATAAALLAKRMGRRCSRYQLKAALIDADLWPQVQSWLSTATARQKLALAEAPEFRRDSQVIADMAAGAGLTEEQLDAVFIAAKALTW
jgi:hypothetical protein